MEEETWKDIKGYEGIYQVSNLGKVRSFSRKYANYGNEAKILKGLNNKGYLRVSLSKNGKCKMFSIHRLVAETFIPNPNNYSCVNHKDENPLNNNVKNLEWCSINYNCNYGNRNKKISEKQKNINNKIIKCIEIDKIYLSLNECARKMNIKAPNIWASINNYNRTKTAKGYTFQYVELNEILDERNMLIEKLKIIKNIIENSALETYATGDTNPGKKILQEIGEVI